MIRLGVLPRVRQRPFASALILWTIQVPGSFGVFAIWTVALDAESLALVYLVYVLALFPLASVLLFALAVRECLAQRGVDGIDVSVWTLSSLLPIIVPTVSIVVLFVFIRPTDGERRVERRD